MPDVLNPKFNIQYFENIALTAGQRLEIGITQNVIYLVENDLSTDLQISFDNGSSFTKWKENFKFSGLQSGNATEGEIKTIILYNSSASTMTVSFYALNGDIDDKTLNVLNTVNIDNTPNIVVSPAPMTVTTTAQAIDTGDCKYIVLQNNDTVDIWIGDANVDPATLRGYKILAGGSAIREIKSDSDVLYCICASTSTLSINRYEKV